jgi:hypothetical protein
MFRVSHRGEGIDDADTIEGARAIVQSTDGDIVVALG